MNSQDVGREQQPEILVLSPNHKATQLAREAATRAASVVGPIAVSVLFENLSPEDEESLQEATGRYLRSVQQFMPPSSFYQEIIDGPDIPQFPDIKERAAKELAGRGSQYDYARSILENGGALLHLIPDPDLAVADADVRHYFHHSWAQLQEAEGTIQGIDIDGDDLP